MSYQEAEWCHYLFTTPLFTTGDVEVAVALLLGLAVVEAAVVEATAVAGI
jgi:hypothetical protein